MIGLLAYVLLFDPAGYIIATIVLSVIVLRILDTKSWWVIGGVSLLLAFGTFFLFDRLLGMPLPDRNPRKDFSKSQWTFLDNIAIGFGIALTP